MTERDEPSPEGPVHYQISVTGRQAAAFLLALLVALGVAFFFGMKTGAASRTGPRAADAAREGDGGSGADLQPAGGEQKLGFSSTKRPTPATEETPAEKDAAASKDGDGAEPAETPTSVSRPPEATPTAPEKAERPPTETPTRGPRPSTPAPTTAPTRPPTAKTPVAKPTAKREGPFFVQVLATKSPQAADDLAKRLKAGGYKADVSLVPGRSDLFRVRIGPYPDRARAEAAAKKVQAKEKALRLRPIVSDR